MDFLTPHVLSMNSAGMGPSPRPQTPHMRSTALLLWLQLHVLNHSVVTTLNLFPGRSGNALWSSGIHQGNTETMGNCSFPFAKPLLQFVQVMQRSEPSRNKPQGTGNPFHSPPGTGTPQQHNTQSKAPTTAEEPPPAHTALNLHQF